MTFGRTPWLKRCLSAINEFCPIPYRIRLLVVEQDDSELNYFLKGLNDERIELIRPNANVGIGSGRRLLTKGITTKLTMFLDDDAYLTPSTIPNALSIFERYDDIGAVSMPHYDSDGSMLDPGGGVLRAIGIVPEYKAMNFDADYVEIEDLDGSAFLCRTDVTGTFAWDERFDTGFEDTDASLQIYAQGRWRLAIVPSGKIIHDRSWLGQRPKYESRRFDGVVIRKSYRLLRAKWRLRRADLRSHMLFEIVYPVFTVGNLGFLVSLLNKMVELRKIKENRRSTAPRAFAP